MIGRLRGEIVSKHPPQLLLEVNGVGYEVEAPMSTFYELPPVGKQVSLFTHLAIRDDAHVLYGFSRESERALFRSLLKVSGVGAKVALAILSGMNSVEFTRCIQDNDSASLTRLPGIGKRTAERLIVEMRDRLAPLDTGSAVGGGRLAGVAADPDQTALADAVSALVALGYRPLDANRMVRSVANEGLSSEQIIRSALQSVAQKG